MINATQSHSIAGAKAYFSACLTQGDYYLGQEVSGHWYGRGADSLGLGHGSAVTKETFEAMLSGFHPVNGEKLAQRLNKNRRPGIDFTFSVKKSVSLLWAINKDERIIDAMREAVRETMEEDVQPLVSRRVRDGANVSTRNRKATGKLIYAEFVHKTARPVKGKTDAHLHVHAFCMNWTEDEGKHYAAELEEVVRQIPSLRAKFDARLARKLQYDLGYEVEKVRFTQGKKRKTSWEIKGIERSTIEKFSKRTTQIEAHAAENDIRDAEAKAKLGQKLRDKKDKGATIDTLRKEWRAQLTPKEREAFDALKGGAVGEGTRRSLAEQVKASVDFAVADCFERNSTVEKHELVGRALQHGLTLLPREVEAALHDRDILHRTLEVNGASREFVTTQDVLDAEGAMIDFVKNGIGRKERIATKEHVFKRDWLSTEQRQAVNHVLNSRDVVTAVMGGAGTGKSSLMEEAAFGIRDNGKAIFTFAPSTGARDVLQSKGFANAQTVEHLLRNEELQGTIKRGDVIWIDEAGLLDVRSMLGAFKIANKQGARVVLSGDTRQHASVGRGDAMRLLESESGIQIARINAIQRQKGDYKRAVEMVSQGDFAAGFDLLDKMGKVHEISSLDRYEHLAERYMEAHTHGTSTLVVSPTHAEGHAVTDEIRSRLREAGAIGAEDRRLLQLKSMNLTVAEKGEAATYCHDGMVLQFMQNVRGGFKRSERYRVSQNRDGSIGLRPLAGGVAKKMPLEAADKFEVYSEQTIEMAAGDKVRFTLSGSAMDGKRRISNGRLDEIDRFDKKGNIVLKSGMTVDRNFGHIDFSYSLTSHASQGKDRKLAIAAMSSQSLPAINQKQFYVTLSRGQRDVAIYVDDKESVRRAINEAGQRLSATEMFNASVPTAPKPDLRTVQERRRRQRTAFHQRMSAGLRKSHRQRPGAPQMVMPGVTHNKQMSPGF